MNIGLVQLRAGRSLIDLVPVDGKLGRAGGKGPGSDGRNLDHLCLRIEPFDALAITTHLREHGAAPGEVAQRYGAGRAGSFHLRGRPRRQYSRTEGTAGRPPCSFTVAAIAATSLSS